MRALLTREVASQAKTAPHGAKPSTKILIVVALSILARASDDRCLPEYQQISGVTHTACKPPNDSVDCQKRKLGVSEQEKETILRVHNELRSKLALGQIGEFPQAADMIKLQWNDELAAVAQAHTEQCKFAHDTYKERITTLIKWTGQNVATISTTRANDTADWPTMINKWFVEYKDAPVSIVSNFVQTTGRPIGHFTQVGWAQTRFVGCGYNSYNTTARYAYKKLYTCNYAKMGNFLRRPVYKEGKPCSQCVAGAKCDNGLCDMSGLPLRY
ncbi:scoloptoxin SSD976-like [Ornithodoros turicata]|uniref:scoloptoxin SSD976-like n=1 Tax=Ornithodoros turicata TaxID=34597 RepID=UPI003139550D